MAAYRKAVFALAGGNRGRAQRDFNAKCCAFPSAPWRSDTMGSSSGTSRTAKRFP